MKETNVSPVITEPSYEMAEASCSIEIHPWNDEDALYLSLWNAVQLHSWLLGAVKSDLNVKPLTLGAAVFHKDGYVARISGYPRAMSHDTMTRLTKAIGEQVQQIKQTCSSLINF